MYHNNCTLLLARYLRVHTILVKETGHHFVRGNDPVKAVFVGTYSVTISPWEYQAVLSGEIMGASPTLVFLHEEKHQWSQNKPRVNPSPENSRKRSLFFIIF